jgi:hypothetical protein
MSKLLSFEGIGVDAATMKLDDATISAIGTNWDGATGKCVARTGNGTVGYGSASGLPLVGVILKAESDGYATVQFSGFAENIAISDDVSKQPAYDSAVCVDGDGKIVKAATIDGDVTSAVAASCTVKSATEGDNLTVSAPAALGASANALKILLTTAENDTLAVTKTDATNTINIALASTTATKNTATLTQAAIRALSAVGGIDVTAFTCTAVGSWNTTAKATGETAAVSFTGGVNAKMAANPMYYRAVAYSVDTTAKTATILL